MDLDKTRLAWCRHLHPPSYGAVVERPDAQLFDTPMDDESSIYLLVASRVRITRSELETLTERDLTRLNTAVGSLLARGRIQQDMSARCGIVYSIPERPAA